MTVGIRFMPVRGKKSAAPSPGSARGTARAGVCFGFAALAVFALCVPYQDALARKNAAPPKPPRIDALEVEPRVLTDADIKLYREIFRVQRTGNWKAADAMRARLNSDILIGHVLFQRYMHPTAYTSSFEELRQWLSLYADHPNADRIYKLALKRRVSGLPRPTTPERRRWRWRDKKPDIDAFEIHNPTRSAAERKKVEGIERYVTGLIRRERPSQALAYLNQEHTRKDLTGIEYDRIRQWISASYYAEKKPKTALSLAADVARRNRAAVPMADWTAGLSAWRLGDVKLATAHFEQLAYAQYIPGEVRAAAAYWAARGRLLMGQPEKWVPLLSKAAREPLTFYGLLATRSLGYDLRVRFELPRLDGHSFSLLTADHGVARAVALAQIGDRVLAEEEMRRAHGRISSELDGAFIALAEKIALPNSQLVAALETSRPGLEAGLFPIPHFTPEDGFLVDRALLYAIMRQESKFDTRALSRADARGLMQVRPQTAVYVSGDRRFESSLRDKLFDPSVNLNLGQQYVRKLMDMGTPKGNLFMVATAYNGGPGNLRRWMADLKITDDPLLFIESIPSPETRAYIENVLTNLWVYRARLGQEAPSLNAVAANRWPVYKAIDKRASGTFAAKRSG